MSPFSVLMIYSEMVLLKTDVEYLSGLSPSKIIRMMKIRTMRRRNVIMTATMADN